MVLEEDVDYIIYAVTVWISFCLFVLCALVVGYLLEWLCPYLLETVGEKVGYLTVAAGLEQLFSLYILGWDLNVEQGTFRGFVWDLDMLMHVLIMGSKIERGGAHHAPCSHLRVSARYCGTAGMACTITAAKLCATLCRVPVVAHQAGEAVEHAHDRVDVLHAERDGRSRVVAGRCALNSIVNHVG